MAGELPQLLSREWNKYDCNYGTGWFRKGYPSQDVG